MYFRIFINIYQKNIVFCDKKTQQKTRQKGRVRRTRGLLVAHQYLM